MRRGGNHAQLNLTDQQVAAVRAYIDQHREEVETEYQLPFNLTTPLAFKQYKEKDTPMNRTIGLTGVLREALAHPGIRLALVFGSAAGGREVRERH